MHTEQNAPPFSPLPHTPPPPMNLLGPIFYIWPKQLQIWPKQVQFWPKQLQFWPKHLQIGFFCCQCIHSAGMWYTVVMPLYDLCYWCWHFSFWFVKTKLIVWFTHLNVVLNVPSTALLFIFGLYKQFNFITNKYENDASVPGFKLMTSWLLVSPITIRPGLLR